MLGLQMRRAALDLWAAARPASGARCSPGLVWVSWVAACRVLLPILKRAMPLPQLVRTVRYSAPRRERTPDRLAARRRTLEHWWETGSPVLPPNCLERGLIVFATLAPGHPDCTLLVGFRKRAAVVEGHAWAMLGGGPVIADRQAGESFQIACGFDATGRRLATVSH